MLPARVGGKRRRRLVVLGVVERGDASGFELAAHRRDGERLGVAVRGLAQLSRLFLVLPERGRHARLFVNDGIERRDRRRHVLCHRLRLRQQQARLHRPRVLRDHARQRLHRFLRRRRPADTAGPA